MSARGFALGAVVVIWLAAARSDGQAGAPSLAACTNRDVMFGLFNDVESSAERCPLPSAADLVGAEYADAFGADVSHAAGEQRALAALRALARWTRSEPQWGAGYAARLDEFLDQLTPRQCDAPWKVEFSALRPPTQPVASCGCAFEAGSEGEPGHACFRFPQPDGPAPVCAVPRLQVYDLPDWQAAARAFQTYSSARAGLIQLSKHCRELVTTRLALAEQRWHALYARGYVQYPWELWLSRALSDDYADYTRCFAADPNCHGEEGLDPQPLRPIFLHPGVGFGFPGFGLHDGKPSAQAEVVVALEALGATCYFDDFRQYLGLSALVGFQAANFAQPRVGLLLHLSRFLQVGYLYGVVAGTRGNGTLYLSVDVLGEVQRTLGL